MSVAINYKANGAYKPQIAIISDVKASATAGGNATGATWTDRILNTEDYDPSNLVTVASNHFTPVAGTYKIEVTSPFFRTDGSKIKLYNVTQTSDVKIGPDCFSSGSSAVSTVATLSWVFTANGSDAYAIQYYVDTHTSGNDLGAATGDSSATKYTVVTLTLL